MGTRGIMGIRVGGVDKIQYNQLDTYPEGLGSSVVEELGLLLTDPGLDGLRRIAADLRPVSNAQPPTAAEIEKFRGSLDIGVSEQREDDWYCLLRENQGELRKTLHAGVVLDGSDFVNDSLFCEYGYIVNLDDGLFECYRGFQHEKHDKGRFAGGAEKRGYWPIALVAAFPLDNIPKDWAERAYPQEEE